MPQIREYLPQTQIRNPVDQPRISGEDIGSGRGLVNLGQAISHAESTAYDLYQSSQRKKVADEKSTIAVKNAELQQKYTDLIQSDANGPNPYSNPNETDPTKKFDEFQLSDRLAQFDTEREQLADSIQTDEGKRYLNESGGLLRLHLQSKANEFQAQLAGEKTKLDFAKALTSNSAALVSDPTAFELTKAQSDSLIDSYVSAAYISPQQAEELKQTANKQLAVSTLKGLARLSPELAQKQLESNRWDPYIDGPTKDSLFNEVHSEQRARIVEANETKRLQKEAENKIQSQNYDTLLEKYADKSITTRDILDANIKPETKRSLIDAISRRSKAPRSLLTNPRKFNDVFNRITNLPDNDPRAIVSEDQLNTEFAKGGLSPSNLIFLRKELNKGKTDEGKREIQMKSAAMNMAKSVLMNGPGVKDPKAPEMLLGFQQEYWKQYDEGIKAGKTPAELTSPDFVNKVLSPFVRSPQQKMQDKLSEYSNFKAKTGDSPAKKASRIDEILKKKGLN